MPNPVEAYLSEVRDLHFSGAAVPETSFYPALSNLLNAVGHDLKPRIRCIVHPANGGAGLPDGGFFTQDQLPRQATTSPLLTLRPARGAMEVKPASADAWETAHSEQVTRYVQDYGQVLVTNLRDFLLVDRGEDSLPRILETYRLAPSEAEFWAQTRHPQTFAAAQGPRLLEFLQRVLLHAAPLTAPQDLAAFLACYAREALYRVEEHRDLAALAQLREALEQALGLQFEGDRGEHFFRSTLVQTLFYGIFSAWVLWSEQHRNDHAARFNWHEASWYLHFADDQRALRTGCDAGPSPAAGPGRGLGLGGGCSSPGEPGGLLREFRGGACSPVLL